MNRRGFFGVICGAVAANAVVTRQTQATTFDRLPPEFYWWGIVFDVTKPGDKFRQFKAVRFADAKHLQTRIVSGEQFTAYSAG